MRLKILYLLLANIICAFQKYYICDDKITFVFQYAHYRHDSESDTGSTSDGDTWGGLGKFEYSSKGLPHALMHYTELITRAGHHGAACTSAVEAAHKHYIKMAAKSSRTYASKNRTEEAMLQWIQRQRLYSEVIAQAQQAVQDRMPAENTAADAGESENPGVGCMQKKLIERLRYMEGWDNLQCPGNSLPMRWGETFIAPKVRITRMEFLHALAIRLQILALDDDADRGIMARMIGELRFECYGGLDVNINDTRRRFVGITSISRDRRDFVSVDRSNHTPVMPVNTSATSQRTCLSAQILAFVKVSGFNQNGITLPANLRLPQTNTSDVTFAMIRWLSPHPRASLRDSKFRPICMPPFDINHALWKFAECPRPLISDVILGRQIMSFEGHDMATRVNNMHAERRAWFYLIQPETFDLILNCTPIDNDPNTIMQTINLPFEV